MKMSPKCRSAGRCPGLTYDHKLRIRNNSSRKKEGGLKLRLISLMRDRRDATMLLAAARFRFAAASGGLRRELSSDSRRRRPAAFRMAMRGRDDAR